MKENLRPFSLRSLSNKSIKSIANYRNRSIDNHKDVSDRFLSICDKNRLRSITLDFY